MYTLQTEAASVVHGVPICVAPLVVDGSPDQGSYGFWNPGIILEFHLAFSRAWKSYEIMIS